MEEPEKLEAELLDVRVADQLSETILYAALVILVVGIIIGNWIF